MYFKMIVDNTIVDVGYTFLKWSIEKKRMFACDPNEGQFVQSYKETHIYKDSWMKPSPEVEGVINAEVVSISEIEYLDIKAMLEEGEEIVVEQPPVVEQPAVQEPEQNKPLSIAEMRALIVEQQKQINELMEIVTG